MKKLRETNVFSHHPLQPSPTDPTQDRLYEDRDMKDIIITRNPLTISKLPCNVVWGIIRATVKPNQRNTIVFEDAVDHGCIGASMSCLSVLVPRHTQSGDLVPTSGALEASKG